MTKLAGVLHMNGGVGETSYAENSYIPMKALLAAKHIKEEAIRKLYLSSGSTLKNIVIADLGCSSRPDAVWSVIYDLIKAVNGVCGQDPPPPSFSIYLNDLPGNDFNTILKSASAFQDTLKKIESSQCFIYAVAGSFHKRLFRKQSLHFIHSSYSLHWLSRVPNIEKSNKGSIHISRISPTNVVNAYYHQFQSDFLSFLTCRSDELVSGGRMVLTLIGRCCESPQNHEASRIWELLAMALNQMVIEGLIEEEKMNMFNIPLYHPSPNEVEKVVREEGSFTIDSWKVSKNYWDSSVCLMDMNKPTKKESKGMKNNQDFSGEKERCEKINGERHIAFVGCMRSVLEPLLVDHFGTEITEEAFKRYSRIMADYMVKERGFFVDITISMCKNF